MTKKERLASNKALERNHRRTMGEAMVALPARRGVPASVKRVKKTEVPLSAFRMPHRLGEFTGATWSRPEIPASHRNSRPAAWIRQYKHHEHRGPYQNAAALRQWTSRSAITQAKISRSSASTEGRSVRSFTYPTIALARDAASAWVVAYNNCWFEPKSEKGRVTP